MKISLTRIISDKLPENYKLELGEFYSTIYKKKDDNKWKLVASIENNYTFRGNNCSCYEREIAEFMDKNFFNYLDITLF